MKQKFIDKRFSEDRLATIAQANAIIQDYDRQGLTLTLRQLYYRFVAKGLIPNTMRSYKNLGTLIDTGRQAGLIDWSAIEDRTRNVAFPAAWGSPEEIVEAVARQYQEDLWRAQPNHVEVWIEKEALVGVIQPICARLRVPYFACRGYVSQSEAYASGRRFFDKLRRHDKQRVVILHFGDHDPSGIDMTRDVLDRLRMFSEAGYQIEVRRLALNMEQIEEYGPPPNPAKITDSRFESYAARFGDESGELDALDPAVIQDLVRRNVEPLRDRSKWEEAAKEESENRERLRTVSERWGDVCDMVDGLRDQP